MALRQLATKEAWAVERLRHAEVPFSEVVRCFAPPGFGTQAIEDTCFEVLYRDERRRPRRAWLELNGCLVTTRAGW